MKRIIFLVKHGEYLPIDPDNRKMRTELLSEKLVEKGFEVHWFTSTFSHQRKIQYTNTDQVIELPSGVFLHLIRSPSYKRNVSIRRILHNIIFGFKLYFKFKKISKKSKPELIFSAYPLIESSYAAALYAKKNNVPHIVDIRDEWPHTFSQLKIGAGDTLRGLYVSLMFIIARITFSKANLLVGMSKGCLQWASNSVSIPYNECNVYPIGFEPKKIAYSSTADWDGMAGKIVFAYAGGLGQFYDIRTVIEAARQLSVIRDDIHIVIAGDGESLNYFEEISADLSNISFVGRISSDALAALYAVSDFGILPYKNIGTGILPNKIGEQLYFGLPLISSITGECKELIEIECVGVYYQSGDPNSLVSSMLVAIEMYSDSKSVARCKDVFLRYFDSNRIYNRLAAKITNVINNVQ